MPTSNPGHGLMLSRREVLVASMAAAGSLLLGGCLAGRSRATGAPFTPSVWLRIDPDDRVTITVARAEMGQGSRNALPMLVAEELEVPWESIQVTQGDLDAAFGEQFAGGSAVVRTSWQPLREAGAIARVMLVQAAAARWGVDPAACVAEAGIVRERQGRRRARYGELTGEAAGLPVPPAPALKERSAFRLIGQRVASLDAPAIVRGALPFSLDVRVPGMLHAVIARSPVFGGQVGSIDDAAARAVAGVRQVIAVDADSLPPLGEDNPKPANGVAVLASSTWAALQGRRALAVTWDDRGGTAEGTDALRNRCRAALQGQDRFSLQRGADADAAWRRATRRLEVSYETQFLSHAPMEPMNCLADVRGDHCEVWAPTQHPAGVRQAAARITGLPLEAITVHVSRMGGAFGRRFYADFAAEAIYLSRAASAPVQVIWTREDDQRHGFYRPMGHHQLRGAVDDTGRISAWVHRLANASRGETMEWEGVGPGGRNPGELSPDDYPVAFGPAFRFGYTPVSSRIPRGQWRAVENSMNVFVSQGFMDELAHLAGRDPLEFRLDLVTSSREQIGNPARYDAERLLRVLREVAQRAEWGATLPAGRGRGIAWCVANGSYVAQVAEVTMRSDTDVHVDRVVSVVDCGLVVNRGGALAQVEGSVMMGLSAAFLEEVTVENGGVVEGNFDRYPVLRISQAPAILTHLIESEGSPGGLGEPALPAVLPAVVNAVFAASGRRFRTLPLRREGIRLV